MHMYAHQKRVTLAAVALICAMGLALATETQEDPHIYNVPKNIPKGPNTIFQETFDDGSWKNRWALSSEEGYSGEWDVSEGEETFAMPGDLGLEMLSEARKHAISVKFAKPVDFTGKKLVFQYEFRIQERMICGGAYVKLFPSVFGASVGDNSKTLKNEFEPRLLDNETPYMLMFGPDRCGEIGRVHLIYQYRNQMSGSIQESIVWPPVNAEWLQESPLTHLYRFELDTATSAFRVVIDGVELRNGTLQSGFEPNPQPPKQIADPADLKPSDWVDDAEIDDPLDVKPDNWDVPSEINDPESVKPLEWDDESDGDWEPAMIPNPEYNGPWAPRRIANPDYKGKWAPRQIDNPHFYIDENPAKLYAPLGGLGFELWSMQAGFMFNNIILTTDPSEADAFTALWQQKFNAENLIKDEIDFANSPPWYRRWTDNLLDFSQENPLIFAGMLMSVGLPLVFWAIINTGSPKKRQPVLASQNSSQTSEITPSTTSPESGPSERRKAKKD